MHSVSPTGHQARFVTIQEIEACCTHKLLPMHIASQSNYNIEIQFGCRNGDSLYVARGIEREIAVSHDISLGYSICVPIVLHVSFTLNSVTKM